MTYAGGILPSLAEATTRHRPRPLTGVLGQDMLPDVDLRLALAIRSEQYRAALAISQRALPASLLDFVR